MSIQSFVLSRCASASSSGFPENSVLKCDQFNCGKGTGCIGGAWGMGGYLGWAGGWGACGAGGVGGAGSPTSAMLIYVDNLHV